MCLYHTLDLGVCFGIVWLRMGWIWVFAFFRCLSSMQFLKKSALQPDILIQFAFKGFMGNSLPMLRIDVTTILI